MLLYADDTSIIVTEPDPTATKQQAISLLNDINSRFTSNLLQLNLNKTQYIEFRTKNYTSNELTNIMNNNLHTVTDTKFLGLTIDYTFSWHPHINSLLKRLARTSYAIRSLKHILHKETLKMIYLSQAQSIIGYGIIFWGQSTEASKIFIMQKRILRIIYNLKPTDSCRNTFKQNSIMTFFSYYIYSLILFVSKNKNQFKLNVDIHQHDTRSKDNIYLPNINLDKVKRGPHFSCIRMFNHLPRNIKALDFNISKHKKILKNFFVQNTFYSVDEYLTYKEQ